MKALIDIAKNYHAIQQSQKRGLPALDIVGGFDFSKAMEHAKSIVDGIYAHEQPKKFNDLGIDTYVNQSGAKIIDAHTVEIGGEQIQGDNIIIATGSGPRLLPVDADNPVELLNNENFWDLRVQPESIAFFGGGVISAELWQALARFGTKVTIIDRNDRILANVDPDVAGYLSQAFEDMGIEIITEADAKICSKDSDGKICIDIQQGPAGSKTPRKLSVDQLFVSIGRVPNINGFDLEAAGIEYTRHGVTVNDSLVSSVPHIFAVGDVAARAKFSHVANYQSELVVRNMLNGEKRLNDLSAPP
jgi:pyruvate/2-oxoglutarate dehydrogenase complex dihydrolipoamide dehydrogenase (E3) component